MDSATISAIVSGLLVVITLIAGFRKEAKAAEVLAAERAFAAKVLADRDAAAAKVLAEERALANEERRLANLQRQVLLEKTDKVIEGNTQIHTLANSTNANLQKTLELQTEKTNMAAATATEKSKGQEAVIAELREQKKDTAAAQAVADAHMSTAMPATPGVDPNKPATEKTLKSIDDNTKRTEGKIAAIKDVPPKPDLAVKENVRKAGDGGRFVPDAPPP